METHWGASLRTGVIAIACLAAGVFFLAFWFGEGHGASLSRLASVQPGMTRKEVVVNLLGEPGTINRSDDGSESWFYSRWTFCQVKVYMDKDGRVQETDHDH
jgi:outer membrane protein assembly factor BamE (lipoprotein component of BamABCDE complex)